MFEPLLSCLLSTTDLLELHCCAKPNCIVKIGCLPVRQRRNFHILKLVHKALQTSGCQTLELQRSCQGVGGSHVTRLNFKTSRVGVYKCLSLIVGFAVMSQFGRGRLSLVAILFYALSLLFGPCRLSEFTLAEPRCRPWFEFLAGPTHDY